MMYLGTLTRKTVLILSLSLFQVVFSNSVELCEKYGKTESTDDLGLDTTGKMKEPYFLIRYSHHTEAGSPRILRGLVYNKNSLRPIIGATIQIDTPRNTHVSKANGMFHIYNAPDDTFDLWISTVGYETLRISDLYVGNDSIATMFICLKPSILPLGRVVTVKGERKRIDFYEGSRPRIRTHGNVFGRIVDSQTGVPLFNVFIWNEKSNRSVKSDFRGVFDLWTVSRSGRDLRFSSAGYDTLMIVNFCRSRKNWIFKLPVEMEPAIDDIDQRRHTHDSLALEPKEYPQVIKK